MTNDNNDEWMEGDPTAPTREAKISDEEILIIESRDYTPDEFDPIDVHSIEGYLLRNKEGEHGVGWRFNGSGPVFAISSAMAREMAVTLHDILVEMDRQTGAG